MRRPTAPPNRENVHRSRRRRASPVAGLQRRSPTTAARTGTSRSASRAPLRPCRDPRSPRASKTAHQMGTTVRRAGPAGFRRRHRPRRSAIRHSNSRSRELRSSRQQPQRRRQRPVRSRQGGEKERGGEARGMREVAEEVARSKRARAARREREDRREGFRRRRDSN